MSDTPLTDRAEYSMYGSRPLVDADFARELEVQLQSAHLKILDLQEKLILISRIAESTGINKGSEK